MGARTRRRRAWPAARRRLRPCSSSASLAVAPKRASGRPPSWLRSIHGGAADAYASCFVHALGGRPGIPIAQRSAMPCTCSFSRMADRSHVDFRLAALPVFWHAVVKRYALAAARVSAAGPMPWRLAALRPWRGPTFRVQQQRQRRGQKRRRPKAPKAFHPACHLRTLTLILVKSRLEPEEKRRSFGRSGRPARCGLGLLAAAIACSGSHGRARGQPWYWEGQRGADRGEQRLPRATACGARGAQRRA